MRSTQIGILALAIALAGCADAPTATSARRLASNLSVDAGTNTARFMIDGFSYGPDFEEYDDGTCYGTYNFVSGTYYGIHVTEYKRVGCAIGSPGGGPYIGGSVTYQVGGSSVSGSVTIDGSEYELLENVPTNQTLYLTAYPNGGYEFNWWIIKDPSGNTHTDTNASISVPTNTSDYEYFAQFHKTS
jgi:hypothetical protein